MAVDISSLSWPTRRPSHRGLELRESAPATSRWCRTSPRTPTCAADRKPAAHADEAEALDYIERQRSRLAEGAGFSFVIADTESDEALGGIGLWLWNANHKQEAVELPLTR